mmetsp:Transcript_11138/g.27372  ORF Transcript_11138/g.27372 Transcript_11138/m.27372 type:complete len:157 (-) Transcript_11138:116-586(-)
MSGCKRIAKGILQAVRREVRAMPVASLSTSSNMQQRTSRIPKKDVVSISDNAANRIRSLIEKKKEKNPSIAGLRLGVKTRGCNGLSFVMDYQEEGKEGKLDEKVSVNGVDVFVDSKAVFYIIGTKMDWVEDELRAEFTFENPNAKGTCGCGESFNV